MTTQGKAILAPMARLIREGFTDNGISLESTELETVLARIEWGDLEGLNDLSGGFLQLLHANTGVSYGPDFFARDPNDVARDLCGSSLVYTGNNSWGGLVTATGGYDTHGKKDKATAEAAPGTVGVYSSRGDILIISAHEPGEAGTIALFGMAQYNGKNLAKSEVANRLQIREYAGERIGRKAPLVIHPRDTAIDQVGSLYVREDPTTKRKTGASNAFKLNKR
jgi:hypothetical protein